MSLPDKPLGTDGTFLDILHPQPSGNDHSMVSAAVTHTHIAAWLSNLTVCGFGIYMIHYFFVFLGYDIGALLHIIAPLRIPFSAIVILVCSWCIVAALRRLLGHRAVYFLG
ncbi:MAG: hypothetical protein K2J00_04650 [Bacteroidaceae bacterium]|nr:hypothetical protein [Bacteroidaceae bacterium]